jgi:drug/metabolite transporter (DMT)-like permease
MFLLLLACYFLLNFVLNYGNKYLLATFPFPVTIILLGTVVYAPLSALVLVLSGQSFPSLTLMRAALPEAMLIGFVHAVCAAAQNVSLAGMSVGLNQVIKACTPAVTLVLSRVLLKSR